MTTPSTTKITLPQKKAFDLYNGQHYRVCLKTFNLKRHLKQSARHVCDQIELFFSSQNKDRAIFNVIDLKKKCNYKDDRTIITSLLKINELGVFFIRDLSEGEFIVFTPKEENIKLVEKIDENNDEYLIWLLKNTREVGKINKKLETFKSKAKTLFSGIVKKHQHVRKSTSTCKKINMSMYKKEHEHEYSYLLEYGDIQVFSEVTNMSLDLLSLDTLYIDHQSLDKKNLEQQLKTSIETLTAAKNNDDDFLNKFDNKSNNLISTEIKASKENEVTKVLPQETKDSLSNKICSVGVGEKTNIPPVRPADCGQAVDNLRDKVITLFDNTDIEEDFRDKILAKYSNEYELILKGLEIMSYQENIKNQTGWLNKFLERKGENYSLPVQLKQKELNQSKETAKHRLAPIIKVFREWYRDNENLDLAKSSLFFSMKELYRQNSQRFIDKVHYCKSQFENFNELTKELFFGEILEIIEAV